VLVKARTLIRHAEQMLEASPAIDHWQSGRERIEAQELLQHAAGRATAPGDDVAPQVRRAFDALISRRATGEPIPLITGTTEFLGLDLIAAPGVFVPRHSSEFLATQAIRRLKGRRGSPVLVDLATGGGTVALAVKDRVGRCRVFGADVAGDAVKLARRNAKRLGLDATFLRGDLFGGLPGAIRGHVDVVTLHPPYVPVGEVQDLPDEVRAWEPEHTLTDGSPDGMGLVQRTVREAPGWLRRDGWVLIEVDPEAARRVKSVMRRGGFCGVESTKGGELKVTRVVVGRAPR
jgi:release factor glutamine methyltransferase